MKFSVPALGFLFLHVELGVPAQVINGTEIRELKLTMHQVEHPVRYSLHFHRPSDCCLSYTRRNIRCVFMASYFETSSGCSRPGVIFVTRNRRRVCANPGHRHVQNCMKKLREETQDATNFVLSTS
ncbi:C-C motif chemokine 15-like [Tenrec ecaudatus]|uniref:C-C motif chemokine 15-like n=1 Tax=Tenrec ecaudatus TaxID=94439 RepID=UPI003F59809F